jgi:hypothetical protein
MVSNDNSLRSLEPFLRRKDKPSQDYLNPDFAYALWVKLGSVARAARYLKDIGVQSFDGKHYSRQAIHLAATHSTHYVQAKKELAKRRKGQIARLRKG